MRDQPYRVEDGAREGQMAFQAMNADRGTEELAGDGAERSSRRNTGARQADHRVRNSNLADWFGGEFEADSD